MSKSAKIQELLLNFLADGEARTVQELKAFLGQTDVSDYSEGQFAGSINTLLRNGSIQKIDRGIYRRRQNHRSVTSMKTCFVVSPIGEADSDTRSNADKLFRYIIKPVCESCGLQAERADQLNASDSITQTIIEKLQSAELVIADISGHNPNVFYEMGYRKCTGKPIIHLKKKGEDIPFDVNTVRTFEYDLTDLDNVEEIKRRLMQAIEILSFEDSAAADVQPEQVLPHDILTILYQMQDSIAELKDQISKRNGDAVRTIVLTDLRDTK